MKYDCTKTIDYMHEIDRMCNTMYANKCNTNCPLSDGCEFSHFKPEHIDIVQAWSDEHPERLKLTREEYNLLQAFTMPANKYIERTSNGLFMMSMEIWPSMFPFIKEGETWWWSDLLKLEVEDEI